MYESLFYDPNFEIRNGEKLNAVIRDINMIGEVVIEFNKEIQTIVNT